jgi:hypothetical protein
MLQKSKHKNIPKKNKHIIFIRPRNRVHARGGGGRGGVSGGSGAGPARGAPAARRAGGAPVRGGRAASGRASGEITHGQGMAGEVAYMGLYDVLRDVS